MNCPEMRLLLHAYVDGELDLVCSLEVEQHLKTCAACAGEYQTLVSLRSALRSAPLSYEAPNALRKQFSKMDKESDDARRPSRPWFWQWLAVGATAAALFLLMVRPNGLAKRGQLADEMVAEHVRSMMADHLTDVLSSDQHTVKPWFDGKLDFAPDVKDFAPQGFPLIGGRLDYINGRDVAALIYRREKHLINVFVWPAGRGDESAPVTAERRGYHIVNRDVNGLHYSLVSDLNVKELGELADLIGK